jgi:hypothetical protein
MDDRVQHCAYNTDMTSKMIAAAMTAEFKLSPPLTANAVIGRLHRLRHLDDDKPAAPSTKVKVRHMRHMSISTAKASHPMVRRLYEEMNRQQCTYQRLEASSGVSRYTVMDWRRRYPRLGDLIDCFQVLGYAIKITIEEIRE